MSSAAKIAANRRNAMKSSGPRTVEGKARSSQNALTHGLTAKHLVASGEDRVEFGELTESILRMYPPRNEMETERVHRLIELIWKLRRARRFETAALSLTYPAQVENAKAGIPETYKIFLPMRGKIFEYSDYLEGWTKRLWKEINKIEDQLRADRLLPIGPVTIEGRAEDETDGSAHELSASESPDASDGTMPLSR